MKTLDFLSQHLVAFAAAAAEGAAYASWSDEFARKEVREVWRNTPAHLRRKWLGKTVTVAALREVPVDDLLRLGFARWSNEGPVLVPLWAYHLIADGETLTCIDGTQAVKGRDEIDLDTRSGCIAFGFKPPTP